MSSTPPEVERMKVRFVKSKVPAILERRVGIRGSGLMSVLVSAICHPKSKNTTLWGDKELKQREENTELSSRNSGEKDERRKKEMRRMSSRDNNTRLQFHCWHDIHFGW